MERLKPPYSFARRNVLRGRQAAAAKTAARRLNSSCMRTVMAHNFPGIAGN